MTKLIADLKQFLVKVLNFIAEEEKLLPVGLTEFHTWADNIITKAGKFADEDSLKYALASMVIHADHAMSKATDSYFVARLRKTAANQVASQVFYDIKTKQEAQKAAQTLAANQAVTPPTESTDGTQTVTETTTS